MNSCGQKSLATAFKSICAEQFLFRAVINRSVRLFSGSCGQNSICADNWRFRASHISVRAGINPSVRPFFDLCVKNAGFRWFLANSNGQKATVSPYLPARNSAVGAKSL
jgi:hypothetical protein